MSVVLGVDGGGSRTRAALADAGGRIVGTASGPSINPRHHGPQAVRERLASLLALVLEGLPTARIAAAFLSLGGISTRADAAAVEECARSVPGLEHAALLVDNDARAALLGGLAGRPGMVLIAGTGSACLGVAADGRRHWCGGWEYLADDAGSAYWIAVEAVRAAVRVEDGRLPPSVLRDLVFGRWAPHEARALAERLSRPDVDRASIAALAPEVISLAGVDSMAASIVDQAVSELSRLVEVTSARLFAPGASEVIFTGGLARSGPPFTPLLAARIESTASGVRVVEPELPPVLGAVIEAARLGGLLGTPFLQGLRGQRVSVA